MAPRASPYCFSEKKGTTGRDKLQVTLDRCHELNRWPLKGLQSHGRRRQNVRVCVNIFYKTTPFTANTPFQSLMLLQQASEVVGVLENAPKSALRTREI